MKIYPNPRSILTHEYDNPEHIGKHRWEIFGKNAKFCVTCDMKFFHVTWELAMVFLRQSKIRDCENNWKLKNKMSSFFLIMYEMMMICFIFLR